MSDTPQKWLERSRPPRVQITYDVETGGAIEKKELPFIIAVLADLSGLRDASAEVTPLKAREVIALDRDNFAAVMAQYQPQESVRRGLAHLVMHLETSAMLQIKVLDLTQKELSDDFEKSVSFDQSTLFKRLYESTYGTYGGLPFSLIVGDYEIGSGAADMAFLTKMSAIAAAVHAPFIASAPTTVFGLPNWQNFRKPEDSRYVTLIQSSAYELATLIGLAFASSHWPVSFAYDDCEHASENTGISVRLPYLLAASRFAHYLKVIMREKIGSFLTRANIESYLNSWISQYVLLDDNATEAAKAAFPLRAANIVVTEIAGRVGSYQATMFIKPHFQLQELTTSMRLVVSLPG